MSAAKIAFRVESLPGASFGEAVAEACDVAARLGGVTLILTHRGSAPVTIAPSAPGKFPDSAERHAGIRDPRKDEPERSIPPPDRSGWFVAALVAAALIAAAMTAN